MPCGPPPFTRTEPTSTFTLRFFTAARDPVISCVQFPRPHTRGSVAPWPEAEATAAPQRIWRYASTFTIHFSSSPRGEIRAHTKLVPNPRAECPGDSRRDAGGTKSARARRPRLHRLVELGQLRDHVAGLTFDVLILIVLSQALQNCAHTAIGPHGLKQMKSFGANSGITVVHKRFENGIAHARIALYIGAQSVEGFEPDPGIRVVPQRVNQSLADVSVIRLLSQQIHRIHANSGVVVVSRGK